MEILILVLVRLIYGVMSIGCSIIDAQIEICIHGVCCSPDDNAVRSSLFCGVCVFNSVVVVGGCALNS